MTQYSGLRENVVRRGFELMEASNKTELEKRWKKVQFLETKFLIQRAKLIHDQYQWTLQAYGVSDH